MRGIIFSDKERSRWAQLWYENSRNLLTFRSEHKKRKKNRQQGGFYHRFLIEVKKTTGCSSFKSSLARNTIKRKNGKFKTVHKKTTQIAEGNVFSFKG